MSTKTLRGLAKDYAKGAIGKDVYRKSRAELIKAIVEGNVAVTPIDYEAPLKPDNDIEDAITEGIQRDKTEITAPQQKPSRPVAKNDSPVIKQNVKTKVNNKKSPFIFILVSCIIVISLILLVVLFYPKPPVSNSENVSETSDIASNSTTTATDDDADDSEEAAAGETLMANFLREKNWSEESINKFTDAWATLTAEEKMSASQTKRMQRMKDSIYKQFLEGKALASIDSEKAKMKQQKLIDFAAAIGIDDSRLILE